MRGSLDLVDLPTKIIVFNIWISMIKPSALDYAAVTSREINSHQADLNSTYTTIEPPVLTRDVTPFQPCRPVNKVTRVAKIQTARVVTKSLSACGFKVINSARLPFGSYMLDCYPKMMHKFCVILRLGYELVSDRNGHLPLEIQRNASVIYQMLLNSLHIYATDFSVSAIDCCPNAVNGSKSCYQKAAIGDLLQPMALCLRKSMNDALPEYFEETTYAADFALQKIKNNGLIKYLMG